MTSLDLNHRELYKEVRTFLLGIFPEASQQIVQNTQNFASLPKDAIVMGFLFDSQLDTTAVRYDAPKDEASAQNSIEARLQLDFYGADAEKRSRIVENLWKSYYGCDNLKRCSPLYVQSRQRQPYINESNQYEDRFILDLALQYNPQVIYGQDFTNEASITVKPTEEAKNGI